jgi:cellulose biosynthesis protein BcsQ
MTVDKAKRITLFVGHYGSGKTNVAVNFAIELAKFRKNVTIADLDIVNPYFRTKDSSDDLEEKGIRLICSDYANTNVDIPALPQDIYAIVDDKTLNVIIDVSGDDRGALALGRLSDAIMQENDYDMFMVVNKFRPLTRDAESTIEVMREIEYASKLKFTGIVNNSNLGEETTAEDVENSDLYAKEICKKTGLDLAFTSIKKELKEKIKNSGDLFPLKLQKKPV